MSPFHVLLGRLASIGSLFAAGWIPLAAQPVTLDGPGLVWHPISLSFHGPEASQADSSPNPFLDYRLQVLFLGPSGQRFQVPGYFDGDGQGGPKGKVWRARFTANQAGEWKFLVSFRHGSESALSLEAAPGEPGELDGANGVINILPRDPQAPGFLKWGRLRYVGKHYLRFEDGPYWIRGGTDSPENFLAYAGFDNTPPSHRFATHVEDWKPGDPDWGDGRGRGIIGALNYLCSRRVNSIYFLTHNIGGDGKDVWPWAGQPDPKGDPGNDNLHFDLAKLRQWETVFSHAQRLGIFLHFVLNEAEEANKRELDDGELGPERKLYYRELIARFAHHLALEWNLCEEYNLQFNFGPARIRAFADYIRAIDPYDHPVTVHSAGDPVEQLRFTFGDERFSLTSIQLNQRPIQEITEAIRRETARTGRPLPASLDEFTVDRGQSASHLPVDDAEGHRREKLWPAYLSGGMIEFILEELLETDSFKTPQRELLWRYVWHARKFMEENLPFWEMEPADQLAEGGATIPVGLGKGQKFELGSQVFAKAGEVYAIYLPKANPSGTLNLSGTKNTFEQSWYNPRSGQFEGQVSLLPGGGRVPLGEPPDEPGQDWVVLLKRRGSDPRQETKNRFPGKSWEVKAPEALGLRAARLDALAQSLQGRGCVVKDGFVVKAWGSQSQSGDWFSSAKPVLSTLLMFALKEKKVSSVDTRLVDLGWNLKEKDQSMTLRHLANMTSGYARPEAPGQAWAYNDFAIQLYQKTLFDRVFREEPAAAANGSNRLGFLGLEDGFEFRESNRRMSGSVRDFARVAWFWLNRGNWNGEQLLPREGFDEFMRPQVPKDLPHTAKAETKDDLKIGTYGGGSDHFTEYGAGIYGFNWWFNETGRLHPGGAHLAGGASGHHPQHRLSRKLLGPHPEFERHPRGGRSGLGRIGGRKRSLKNEPSPAAVCRGGDGGRLINEPGVEASASARWGGLAQRLSKQTRRMADVSWCC